MKTFFLIVCIVFLLHAAAPVESRRHRDDRRQQQYKLFVFGDNFVDNGNTDKEKLTWWTRNWYEPYGFSDGNHSHSPTGRFSDGKVQSDFLAMILGYDESPAPENRRQDGVDPFGMNFAVSFASVKDSDPSSSNFTTQIGRLRRLLRHGLIDKDISKSVALVAFSGFDYTYIPDEQTDHDGFVKYIDDVTDAIADGVSDILDLGVTKVLVNMMQPMGCSPRYTRTPDPYGGTSDYYSDCIKDNVTEIHNRKIKEKLGSEDAVLLLDMYATFNGIIHPIPGSGFLHGFVPCCESNQRDGYCGQVDQDGVQQYKVCDNPNSYFYFDDWHPTQAGWKAVMNQLEGPIKEFLDISS